MKTRIAICAALLWPVLLIVGCYDDIRQLESEYANSRFEERIADVDSLVSWLESYCREMNGQVVALHDIVNAIAENDYVISVMPITENGVEVGKVINFKKSGAIAVHYGKDGQNGNQGHTPQLGIRQDDDGLFYWTLDGEWLLGSEGEKLSPVGRDGADCTPKFKIVEEQWYISYDQGVTWFLVGNSAGAAGANGDAVFKSVREVDGSLIIITADGTELHVMMRATIGISFDIDEQCSVSLPGKEVKIGYCLDNATDSTIVTATSDGRYGVRIEKIDAGKGTIAVSCPDTYAEGYINVMVMDGSAYSFVRVINFYEGKIDIPEGLEYEVPTAGGDIVVPFNLNFDYSISTEGSWLGVDISTKADDQMRKESLTIHVEKNNHFYRREGRVYIYSRRCQQPVATIVVNQASAYFELEHNSLTFYHEGNKLRLKVRSSKGLEMRIPDSAAGWLEGRVLHGEADDLFWIELTALANASSEKRNAVISCYSTDDGSYLGRIGVVQLDSNPSRPDDMVFIVRANVINEYTATVPLYGRTDCYVNWGDGNVEYVLNENSWASASVSHTYADNEIREYQVRISGRVEGLRRDNATVPSIAEVVQWGQVGLVSMHDAFRGEYLLRKIPDDTEGSFMQVSDFYGTFCGCTSLKSIPKNLFAYCYSARQFNCTFEHCLSLTDIPETLFSSCENVDTFNATFRECTDLRSIPSGLFSKCQNIKSFAWTFENCIGLESLPDGLFSNCSNVLEFIGVFDECKSLKTIPATLFSGCPEVRTFERCFMYCVSLLSIPSELFSNCSKVSNFCYTFWFCTSATGESPYSVVDGAKVHLYERYLYPDVFVRPYDVGEYRCFTGSYKLSDYDSIPTGWK